MAKQFLFIARVVRPSRAGIHRGGGGCSGAGGDWGASLARWLAGSGNGAWLRDCTKVPHVARAPLKWVLCVPRRRCSAPSSGLIDTSSD